MGTSVERITAEAKISKGLFYHYFKSKEELLLSFYSEIRGYFENLKTYENPLDALKKFGCDFLANNEEEYKNAPLLQVFFDNVRRGKNRHLKARGRKPDCEGF